MYYDRLVDQKDRELLYEFVRGVTMTELLEDFDRLFIHLDFDEDEKVTEDDLRSLIFCDFSDTKSDNRLYTEARDMDQLWRIAESHLDEYNNMTKKTMNLVMFRYSHSFIHSGYFYSASSSLLQLRGAPDYSIDTVLESTRRSPKVASV